MARRRARTWLAKIVMWGVRLFFAVILGFPFYWMLITTFKRNTDLNNLQNNPFIYNERPTLDHLKLLFHETMFPRWVLNTAFAGLVVVIITLLLAVPAAYALARLTGNWGAQLGIGANEVVVCGMALGYADPDAPENRFPVERADVNEFATFVDFDR